MNIHSRIRASSLLESVLALALLAGALSFSVGLHFRVLTADRSSDRLQAWSLSESLAAAPLSDGREATLQVDGMIGERVLSPYAPGLYEAHIRVQRNGHDILDRRLMIPHE